MKCLYGLFVAAARVFGHPDTPSRARLFLEFLRIRIKKAIFGLFRIAATEERVLGFRVRFSRYSTFVYLFEEIFIQQQYYFRTDNARPLIFDCGSNIGMAILYFKWRYPLSRIVAFEPDPGTFAILKENVERNGFSDVELHNEALWSSDGILKIYSSEEEPGSPRAGIAGGSRPIEVRASRLSEYLRDRVDLLKMDIEGAENECLAEVAQQRKMELIRRLVLEYHHHPRSKPENESFSQQVQMLEASGFALCFSASYRPEQPVSLVQDLMIYGVRL